MDIGGVAGVDLVQTTKAEGTARVACFARLGNPDPDSADQRGEGVVDFAADQLWLADRLVTDRLAREQYRSSSPVGRPILRLFYKLMERALGGGELIVFEGGALRRRQSDGSWSRRLGNLQQPKYPRHPLCAFAPLERVSDSELQEDGVENVRGVQARRLKVLLAEAVFDPSVWSEINSPAAGNAVSKGPEPVQAFVWIDPQGHILRLSFEGSRSDARAEGLWCVTELWDWGVSIPPEMHGGLKK
jgi:hypothetical protein